MIIILACLGIGLLDLAVGNFYGKRMEGCINVIN